MSRVHICSLASLALCVGLVVPHASAQRSAAPRSPAPRSPTPHETPTPDAVAAALNARDAPSASPYAQAVARAIEQLVAHDLDGAEVSAREALRAQPGRPEGHYYLAVALRTKGQGDEALAEYRAAAQMGSAVGEPIWQARGMQGAAEVLENLPGRLGDAREAWSQLLAFAQGNADVIARELPRARITAIDRASEQERVYIDVRQRIAAREAALAQQAAEPAQRPQHGRRRGDN